MKPGQVLNISEHIRSFDESSVSYWVNGPILVLGVNKYDVTFLSCGKVLYASHQELAVEVELGVS